MKPKASVLTIRVPAALKKEIARVSENQGVSINQFALYAFTKEIAEVQENGYIQKLLKKKSREQVLADYDMIIAKKKYSKKPAPAWDKMQ